MKKKTSMKNQWNWISYVKEFINRIVMPNLMLIVDLEIVKSKIVFLSLKKYFHFYFLPFFIVLRAILDKIVLLNFNVTINYITWNVTHLEHFRVKNTISYFVGQYSTLFLLNAITITKKNTERLLCSHLKCVIIAMHNKKHEFSLLDNITFELDYTIKL